MAGNGPKLAGDGQGGREMAGDGREWPGVPVGLHARVLKRGALALRDFFFLSFCEIEHYKICSDKNMSI